VRGELYEGYGAQAEKILASVRRRVISQERGKNEIDSVTQQTLKAPAIGSSNSLPENQKIPEQYSLDNGR
jgi:hypothetical protein